jgi:predicted membrane protein
MGGSFFWGVLLVIVGLTMIIKVVFHIDIPVFRVLFAFIFIFIGIRILAGNSNSGKQDKRPENIIFGDTNFAINNKITKEQNILFGRGFIDLRNIDSTSLPTEIEINTVFGSAEIIIPKNIQVRIKIDAAFAGATLPNNNTSAFGSSFYESPGFDANKPFLYIKTSVAFGSLHIRAF